MPPTRSKALQSTGSRQCTGQHRRPAMDWGVELDHRCAVAGRRPAADVSQIRGPHHAHLAGLRRRRQQPVLAIASLDAEVPATAIGSSSAWAWRSGPRTHNGRFHHPLAGVGARTPQAVRSTRSVRPTPVRSTRPDPRPAAIPSALLTSPLWATSARDSPTFRSLAAGNCPMPHRSRNGRKPRSGSQLVPAPPRPVASQRSRFHRESGAVAQSVRAVDS